MSLPVVAIVGRPNVGKSTLINRIISDQEAIVDERSGVTRDRIYYLADWNGRQFTLIDTGGLQFGKLMSISQTVQQQALIAMEEASVVIFMVDAKTGILPDDEEIAKLLKATQKPVILTVNKIDSEKQDALKYDFYKLGFGDPIDISSSHGRNIGDFLDQVIEQLPAEPGSDEKGQPEADVAIAGRPNAGKSSLFNRLAGEERVIVSEVPCTTRDAVDTVIEHEQKKYRFIDTAGLKKASKRIEDLDYYGMVRTLRVLDRADLVLLVIDAHEGVTAQDQKIAELITDRGCAGIILLNKWDLLNEERKKIVQADLNKRLRFASYMPDLKVSALTGLNLGHIYRQIDQVNREYHKRVPTNKLNVFLQELKAQGHLPSKGRKQLKIAYLTQARTAPPVFVFFMNYPEIVVPAYKRYLENQLRGKYGFTGCPVRLFFKSKK